MKESTDVNVFAFDPFPYAKSQVFHLTYLLRSNKNDRCLISSIVDRLHQIGSLEARLICEMQSARREEWMTGGNFMIIVFDRKSHKIARHALHGRQSHSPSQLSHTSYLVHPPHTSVSFSISFQWNSLSFSQLLDLVGVLYLFSEISWCISNADESVRHSIRLSRFFSSKSMSDSIIC
jgi:hypothetical protein